ncbi:hypothetical protein ACJMK2_012482 [Sinanodonta woodiana]|uniref:Uncharacterized protein n=1 Tax=Sinanodonta woodiana TaxID=1069815 RepID=A0ABD3V8B7_SINWO
MEQFSNVSNTTVVINQPAVVVGPKLLLGTKDGSRDWTTGLCGCFENICSLFGTCCCLPCMLCSLSVRLGDCLCMPLCVPDAVVAMRARTRTLGDIRGTICMDYVTTAWCGPCVVCQMDRELTAMGL